MSEILFSEPLWQGIGVFYMYFLVLIASVVATYFFVRDRMALPKLW